MCYADVNVCYVLTIHHFPKTSLAVMTLLLSILVVAIMLAGNTSVTSDRGWSNGHVIRTYVKLGQLEIRHKNKLHDV